MRFGNSLVYYYVKAVGEQNLESSKSNTVSVRVDDDMVAKELVQRLDVPMPLKYASFQNHPNPFNPVTTIWYALPEASYVNMVIYDVTGGEVRTWNIEQEPGYKETVWDGRDNTGNPVPTGVYIYRLTAQSTESDRRFTQTRKMVLLR